MGTEETLGESFLQRLPEPGCYGTASTDGQTSYTFLFIEKYKVTLDSLRVCGGQGSPILPGFPASASPWQDYISASGPSRSSLLPKFHSPLNRLQSLQFMETAI